MDLSQTVGCGLNFCSYWDKNIILESYIMASGLGLEWDVFFGHCPSELDIHVTPSMDQSQTTGCGLIFYCYWDKNKI